MGMTDMLQRKFTEFGIEQGIEKGIQEDKLTNAQNGIQKGYDNQIIADITGLTPEQVAAIRKDMAAN